MNFFGLFGGNKAEEPKETTKDSNDSDGNEKQDDHNLSHTVQPSSNLQGLGGDKIFSNINTDTGEVKANHYNPPNLFLGLNINNNQNKKPVEKEEENEVDLTKRLSEDINQEQLDSLYTKKRDTKPQLVKQHNREHMQNKYVSL